MKFTLVQLFGAANLVYLILVFNYLSLAKCDMIFTTYQLQLMTYSCMWAPYYQLLTMYTTCYLFLTSYSLLAVQIYILLFTSQLVTAKAYQFRITTLTMQLVASQPTRFQNPPYIVNHICMHK